MKDIKSYSLKCLHSPGLVGVKLSCVYCDQGWLGLQTLNVYCLITNTNM